MQNTAKQNYPGSVAFYGTGPGHEVGLFYNKPEPKSGDKCCVWQWLWLSWQDAQWSWSSCHMRWHDLRITSVIEANEINWEEWFVSPVFSQSNSCLIRLCHVQHGAAVAGLGRHQHVINSFVHVLTTLLYNQQQTTCYTLSAWHSCIPSTVNPLNF